MFANFDYSYFPYVIVKLNKTIKDEEDFNYLLDKWTELYEKKENFIFVFDTTNVGCPPIKYCFKLSNFIKKLKKRKEQYLKKSIIIVKSKIVKYLLEFIFKLQGPVADVYIISNDLNETIEILKEKQFDKLNITNKIKSGESFFSIFR